MISRLGLWRIESLSKGLKYARGYSRIDVLKSLLFKEKGYWLHTPYGIFHCPDIASAMQFSTPWEKHVRKIIGALRNKLFVDVGANIGFYTILAAYNHNFVISVEPNLKTFICLTDNVLANFMDKRVELYNVAAWSEDSHVHIASKGYSDVTKFQANGELTIALKLDSILDGSVPDLVKIDIEGAEPEALQGLSNARRIIFEALTRSKLEECRAKLWKYRIERLDRTNYLATLT